MDTVRRKAKGRHGTRPAINQYDTRDAIIRVSFQVVCFLHLEEAGADGRGKA